MPVIPKENLLLVEGKEEKRVIPELIEKNGVQWELGHKTYVVDIEDAGGVEPLLDGNTLSAYAKRSGLRRLGVIVDGDTDPVARWQQLRRALLDARLAQDTDLPAKLEKEGFIGVLPTVRLGVWIMPDNTTSGMLETFLAQLVRGTEGRRLDEYVLQASVEALSYGATFKNPTQLDKARIHCWLAWQDEPGRQLHQAILFDLLDAGAPQSQPFVSWFRKLFELL